MIRLSLSLFVLAAFLLCSFTAVPAIAQKDTLTIATLADGPWFRNEEIQGMFEHEIRALLEDEYVIEFPDKYQQEADWTVTGIMQSLDNLVADPDVDFLIAMGVKAGSLVASKSPLPYPVIAPFVIDPELIGLDPEATGKSGIENFNFLSTFGWLGHDIEIFHEIVPFHHLAILIGPSFIEDLPRLSLAMDEIREQYNAEVTLIPLAKTATETMAKLPAGTDAALVSLPGDLPLEEYQALINDLIERKIPLHSMMGRFDVELGALSTLMPDEFFFRRARRTAINMQRILSGTPASELPVAVTNDRTLIINMATARAIDVYPDWAMLTEAELINASREEVAVEWSLADVVRQSVQVNLGLEAKRKAVEAGETNVGNAWANLLPQLDAAARAVYIDSDRAEASFGMQAEGTYSGVLSLTQVIFSEQAWANLSIQKSLQRSRLDELRSLSNEIAHDAAVAYLNVLRANAYESVQRTNLDVTRANLELAEVRQTVGVAGPSELYRWQAQIANDKKAVINANMQRNLAEMQLNRMLNRPIEEQFVLDDVSLLDDDLGLADPTIQWLMSNPWNFRVMRNFFAGFGVENNPMIQQIDATIDAQERLLASKNWQFIAPTIAVQAEVEQLLERTGVSDMSSLFSSLPPDIAQSFANAEIPTQDDTNWSIGINASLPLFHGGSRIHDRAKAKLELEQLRNQRGALAEGIEQQIRTALHKSGASYASIELARDAAEAARKSLEVVQDAYAQGAVSIIDLLDAQNASRSADLAAADAVYTFLIDYFDAQNSFGTIIYLTDVDEREAIVQQLLDYFNESGTPVGSD
ncbi:TolC family protein [bacterium]|nr:TolC family protein [bacterium]